MAALSISILSVISVANLILGLIIFSRGIRKISEVLFGLIALATAVWGVAIIGFYSEQVHDLFNWIIITHSTALFIPYLFLQFSVVFPRKLGERKKIFVLATLTLALLEYAIFFTPYVIGQTHGYNYVLGPLYVLYSVCLILFFFFGFLFSYLQIKVSVSAVEKNQAKYVLIGSIVASSLAIVPDLILPYLSVFSYTWLGPMFTLVMVVALFMAMLRYHLFNIKVIFTEIVSITIIIALLIELFIAKSASEIFLKAIVLVVVSVFCYLLIKGVYVEIAQREALAIANAGQESLIHAMNHQIKGYLGKNRNIFAELLTSDYGVIPDTAKPLINEGLNQSAKGVDYVQSILKGASAAKGVLPYDMKPFDTKKLIIDTIAQQKPFAKSRGLKYESDVEEGEFMVNGDASQLGEAYRNLIENAIRYNSPNGSIKVVLKKVGKEAVFSVRDTGKGVSEADKPRMFTPGGMGRDSIKYNAEASGFGLAFVKGVVDAHKGTVGFEPNVGEKGTTFFIKLPLV